MIIRFFFFLFEQISDSIVLSKAYSSGGKSRKSTSEFLTTKTCTHHGYRNNIVHITYLQCSLLPCYI
jgi:hypothetical protein